MNKALRDTRIKVEAEKVFEFIGRFYEPKDPTSTLPRKHCVARIIRAIRENDAYERIPQGAVSIDFAVDEFGRFIDYLKDCVDNEDMDLQSLLNYKRQFMESYRQKLC